MQATSRAMISSASLTWRQLLVATAAATVALLLLSAAILGDKEPAVLAVVGLGGLGLLRLRGGKAGVVLLALLCADVVFWTILEVSNDLLNRGGLQELAIPAALAAVSLAGLVAAVASLVRHWGSASDAAVVGGIGVGALALFLIIMGMGLALGQNLSTGTQPGDITLQAQGAQFSETMLSAQPGEVTVILVNHDLFWHTFTVDQLGLNLAVPGNSARRITFKAAPGMYHFYCAIPGHAGIGMQGTLTVK